jgi:hypothetical protein
MFIFYYFDYGFFLVTWNTWRKRRMAKCGNDDDFSQMEAKVVEKSQNEDMALSALRRGRFLTIIDRFSRNHVLRNRFVPKLLLFPDPQGWKMLNRYKTVDRRRFVMSA